MSGLRTMPCPRCWATGLEPPELQAPCLLCEGRGTQLDSQLSEHFWMSELVVAHEGYMQDPPSSALDHLRMLCLELLEPVRRRVGPLRVTSGYRCPSYDAHVAGSETRLERLGAHATGAAADVVPATPGYSLRDVMDAAADVAHDQRILEGGCCHLAVLSPYPVGSEMQRRQAFVRLAGPEPSVSRWIYARYDPLDPTQHARAV